jgi:membrane protease YdiL (CAAX protease family)
MKKIGNFASCIVPFLYLKIISYFAILTIQSVYVKVNGIPYRSINISIDTTHLFIMGIIAILAYLPVFAVWYQKLIKNEKRNLRNFYKDILNFKNFICIIALGLSLQFVLVFIASYIYTLKPEWFASYHELMSSIVEVSLFLKFISIVILGPMVEELVFRGVILKKSIDVMPFIAANILQSLLFGIAHGNMLQGLYTFLLGLFLGYIYIKTKTIIAPMGVHMAFNLSSIILEYLKLDWDKILYFPVVGVIIFLASIAFMILCTKILINKNKVEEEIFQIDYR